MANQILDNQQKYTEILSSKAEKICVIAGPGSGKTKGILIPKAKQIVADQTINPNNVLILSFSRLSALDLKDKIKNMDRTPRTSTLHSFCLSFLLSEDNHDIRKRINSIILDFEKQILISDLKIVLTDLNKREIKKMLDEFSAGWAINPHEEVFIEDEKKKSFKSAILNWLSENEAAMMEEIVYHAVDLAKKVNTNFVNDPQYIFVDEYQDLNRLEQEFIDLLGANSKLVLVAGDPDQSIYSFKFAHPEGINSFSRKNNVETHTLDFSGRCAKKIIKIANQLLLQANPTRKDLPKPLIKAEDGEAILIQKDNQVEEFNFIFQSIIKKVETGTAPSEFLILVPRKKLGMEFVKFTKSKKVENIAFEFTTKSEFSPVEQEKISLLGVIANPNSTLRVRIYIGLKDKNYFSNELVEIKQKYGNLQEAIKHINSNDFDKKKKKIIKVCELLRDIKNILEKYNNILNVEDIINDIFPEDNEELEEIRSIILLLKESNDSLQSLYSKLIDYYRTIHTRDNIVRVMTLIASKGLEAGHVYILGCNGGNIPGENRSVYLNDHEFKREQRRLLYVGVTRAKKSLIITWSRNIPFDQSKGHYTKSVRTITKNGKKYSQVGLSEFLQNIDFS